MRLVPDRWSIPYRSDLQSDPTWRYAILAGTCTIPFPLALEWVAPRWSLAPVFVIGFLVGYVVDLETPAVTRVGFRAGAIGAIGMVLPRWMQISLPRSGTLFEWIGVLSLVLGTAVWILLTAALVGVVATGLGHWLSRQIGLDPVRTSKS